MENEFEFELVNGNFNPEEAKTVINSLINSKINFHNLEDFSNSIRFNSDSSHSKIRIEQLNEIKTKINQLLTEANSKNLSVELNCHFEVKFK
ncbi:hypothetical protein [Flavobacterium ammonificans]|jgi:hypothetical protein|uniref:Uncharacterized protein n=1 Tax=Flavobacterium ammonificans TaxID=1751056 RepID=A0ABM7UYP2_9FLAO|nr:hypothetical protein [Flavobacterium ammonificans]BDB52972.1 hypothetical protein GENT11_12840 [Flavobacterium ammonificans]